MKKHGNKRTDLRGRRLWLVLLGRYFGRLVVQAVVFFAPLVARSTDLTDVVIAVDDVAEKIDALSGYIEDMAFAVGVEHHWEWPLADNMHDSLASLAHEQLLQFDYWTNNNQLVVGRDPQHGIRRDILRATTALESVTNFFLPTENSYYLDPDVNSIGLSFWDYKYGDSDYVTPSFVEFMSLTQGQTFDAGTFWAGETREWSFDNAFGGINGFGPSAHPIGGEGGEIFGFWVPWQAEAWRRQLGALGAITNTWASFTNSAALASLNPVFDDPEFGSYYQASNFAYEVVNQAGMDYQDGTNDVSLSMGIQGQLPKLGFELVGTDVVEFTTLSGVTNSSTRITAEELLPSVDTGQWLYRVGTSNNSAYEYGVFEVDLNGNSFAQWAERFPDWIKLICDVIFYAFSLVMYIWAGFYLLDKLPE